MKIPVDFGFEIDEPDETITVGELLKKFYERNRGVIKPISLVLNPETRYGCRLYSDTDIWIAVYYGHFYIEIKRSYSKLSGPHKTLLYYQISSTPSINRIWLGTCQIQASFFYISQIRKKLTRALRLRQYFASEKSKEELVNLNSKQIQNSEIV